LLGQVQELKRTQRVTPTATRRGGWAALCVLSLGVAVYALVAYTLAPPGATVHPQMRATFEAHRPALYAHVFGALVALALGPFEFSGRLRTARLGLHRWLGRLYLGAGVLIGGLAGLYLAFHAFGGPVARIGFGCLALAWLYAGARAYAAARAGAIDVHRRWMVRSFALTFAAVTLRIYLPASVVSGIDFEFAYPAIAWLCWVPNLLVAEFVFNRGARQPV
jgi:uncharacterized membrane protein